MHVTAEPDDETVIVSAGSFDPEGGIDLSESWRDLIGAEFWWGWIAVNQQGYSDGVVDCGAADSTRASKQLICFLFDVY